MTLAEQRAARLEDAQRAYQAALDAPLVAVGRNWTLDAVERDLLTQYVVAQLAGGTVPANLILQANSGAVVTLTPADAIDLLAHIVTRNQRLRIRLYVVTRDILATTNPAVVDTDAEWI